MLTLTAQYIMSMDREIYSGNHVEGALVDLRTGLVHLPAEDLELIEALRMNDRTSISQAQNATSLSFLILLRYVDDSGLMLEVIIVSTSQNAELTF